MEYTRKSFSYRRGWEGVEKKIFISLDEVKYVSPTFAIISWQICSNNGVIKQNSENLEKTLHFFPPPPQTF